MPLRRVTRQKSQLPSREIEICLRVKEARLRLHLDQSTVAERIGLRSHAISNIEKCRAPVRFDLGLRLCRELIVSEEWLATGKFVSLEKEARRRRLIVAGSAASLHPIFFRRTLDLWSEDLTRTIPPRTLFSTAFDETLKILNARLVSEGGISAPRLIQNPHDGPEIGKILLNAIIDERLFFLRQKAWLLGKEETLAQREYLRAMFEFGDVLYKRFMGFPTPEVTGPNFDFLRVIVSYLDVPVGSLHASQAPRSGGREKKRKAPKSGAKAA